MKKVALLLGIVIGLSSCTRTGYSAASGAMYGSMLGGTIGGLVNGHRGHHLGTVVGLITGAAVGAASEAAREKRYREYVEEYDRTSHNSRRDSRSTRTYSTYQRESLNGNLHGSTYHNSTEIQGTAKSTNCPLTLRNLRFIDDGGNQVINREEEGKIIFELANSTSEAIYDVVPYIYEKSGNSHLYLSPSTRIEVIKPGDVVRYTCSFRSDKKLAPGVLNFCVSVSCSENDFVTLREFSLPSAK